MVFTIVLTMILRRREGERGGARRERNTENFSVKPVTLALLVSCSRDKTVEREENRDREGETDRQSERRRNQERFRETLEKETLKTLV